VHCGERKIPFGWMYATCRFLLLPAYRRGRLLDAVDKMARLLLLERRNELRARLILARMMAARVEYAAGWRIRRRGDVAVEHDAIA
jgi:hypothetical protein